MTRASRGAVLVYAVVLVTVFAAVAAMLVNLMMGQAVIVQKTLSGDAMRFGAQGAQARLNECLKDASAATCNDATLAACGFPLTVGDKTVAATTQGTGLGWVNSACVVSLNVTASP